MTQDELGERLGVSAQAVSKWERGLSLPDAALLPDVAAVFKTGVDALFEDKTETGERKSKKDPAVIWESFAAGNFEPFMSANDAFDEVLILVSADLFELEDVNEYIDAMLDGVQALRKKFYAETGVVLPVIRMRDQSNPPPKSEAMVLLRGKEIWKGKYDSEEDYSGARAIWEERIGASPARPAEKKESALIDWAYGVLNALYDLIRESIIQFNTLDHTARVIEGFRTRHPKLVEAATEMFPLCELREIFNALLKNDKSVYDLLSIFERLLEYGYANEERSVEGAVDFLIS